MVYLWINHLWIDNLTKYIWRLLIHDILLDWYWSYHLIVHWNLPNLLINLILSKRLLELIAWLRSHHYLRGLPNYLLLVLRNNTKYLTLIVHEIKRLLGLLNNVLDSWNRLRSSLVLNLINEHLWVILTINPLITPSMTVDSLIHHRHRTCSIWMVLTFLFH